MDNKAKEIRRILLGQLTWTEDGRLTAAQSGQRMRFQGLVNGWGAVRFLGVTHRERKYQLADKASAKEVRNILSRMGQAVELKETPKAFACLCRFFMMAPVLVTVETAGTQLQVTAFTGRDPLSPMLCRRALDGFEKELPEAAVLVVEEKPKQTARRTKSGERDASAPPKRAGKGERKRDKRSDAQ